MALRMTRTRLSLKQGVRSNIETIHSLLEKMRSEDPRPWGNSIVVIIKVLQEAAENVPDETVLEELQSELTCFMRPGHPCAMVKIAKNTGKPSPAV